MRCYPFAACLAGERGEVVAVAKNVVSQMRVAEEEVFEVVENCIGWGVKIAVDLFADNYAFTVDFMWRKYGIAHQVGYQFDSTGNVSVGKHGVDFGFLFCGECVQLASDGLHPVADVGGAPA